ncbi:MAG TPA: hypothetical protein VGH08_00900 [Chthoniobacterales bacterium]|jgi:hypothetical protein
MPNQVQPAIGHETRDLNVRAVALFAAGMVLCGAIIYIGTAELFAFFKRQHPSAESPSRIAVPHPIAPEPRLQENPTTDFDRFRATEEAKLNSYGWVDKERNVIRIPIERAMDLIAQRGLPVRSGPDDRRTSGKTLLQMQQEKAAPSKP